MYINHNALAELAEFLKDESKVSKSEEFKARAIASFGEDSWKRYLAKKNKMAAASRIVSELAKVKFRPSSPYGIPCALATHSVSALNKCRAIAEKGVEDGR